MGAAAPTEYTVAPSLAKPTAPSRSSLPRVCMAGSWQRLFIFFQKKNLCREPSSRPLGKDFLVFFFKKIFAERAETSFAESQPGRLSAKLEFFRTTFLLCRVPAILALGKAGIFFCFFVFFLFLTCTAIYIYAQIHMSISQIHIYITHETYRSP